MGACGVSVREKSSSRSAISIGPFDRLMHHAHFIETKGDSHRLAEALAGKGVIPLT